MVRTGGADLSNELAETFRRTIKERYIGAVNRCVRRHYENERKNPSKELRLLALMKEFSGEGRGERIDGMIEALTLANTYRDIKDGLAVSASRVSAAESDTPSVHSDGVYDVDDNCLARKYGPRPDALSAIMMMIFLNGR
jgi:hypothetical protein